MPATCLKDCTGIAIKCQRTSNYYHDTLINLSMLTHCIFTRLCWLRSTERIFTSIDILNSEMLGLQFVKNRHWFFHCSNHKKYSSVHYIHMYFNKTLTLMWAQLPLSNTIKQGIDLTICQEFNNLYKDNKI